MGGLNCCFSLYSTKLIRENQTRLCFPLLLIFRIKNFGQSERTAKISKTKTTIMRHLAVVVFNLVEMPFKGVIFLNALTIDITVSRFGKVFNYLSV